MRRLGTARAVVTLAVAVIVLMAVLAGSYVWFVGGHSSPDGTYVESPSSIRSSLHSNATSGHVKLRVDKVADASTREMRTTWERYNREDLNGSLYSHPLVPPAGEKYLIANITVTNTAQRDVSFSYGNTYLVGRDGSTYYANYASAETSVKQLNSKGMLRGGATDTLYVLFAVPSEAQPVKLVYDSHPPIVVRLT